MRVVNIDNLEWVQITVKELKDKAILILKPHINDLNWFEAEPVRHGQWVRNGCGETYCSECHNRIPYIRCYDFYPDCCMDDEDMQWDEEIERTTYCPNCGAKMDLKE